MNNYNFTVKGEGENILLVHGWGGSIESLSGLQNKLSKNYKVYNLELPGHGISPQMDSAWSMDDFVQFIINFLDAVNVNKIIYIGHSFGGKIGIKLSASTEVISKLVLINSSGIKPNNSLKKIFWKLISFIVKPISNLALIRPIKSLFYKFIIGERDYTKTSGKLKETFKIIVDQHLDNKLKSINIPTLIIWGIQDTTTPLYMAHKLNKGIKGSQLITHTGAHGLPLKKPELIGGDINNWLAKHN